MESIPQLSADNAQFLRDNVDVRKFGFNDAVVISGMDPRQLRNGLDRSILQAGEKHRSGRWTFSMRDCFYLTVVAMLTNGTWTPVSQAAQVASKVQGMFLEAFDEMERFREGGNGGIHCVNIYAEPGDVRIVLQRRSRDDEPAYSDLDGRPVKHSDVGVAYVRLPLWGVFSALFAGILLCEQDRAAEAPE